MARQPAATEPGRHVTGYKAVLSAVLERRPSGMRQRLAEALGKNRSFITQIANPAYDTPIPARHVETIFAVCHFSADERRRFLADYRAAHPGRHAGTGKNPPTRTIPLTVPDCGDARSNARLDAAIQKFVEDMTLALRSGEGKGPAD